MGSVLIMLGVGALAVATLLISQGTVGGAAFRSLDPVGSASSASAVLFGGTEPTTTVGVSPVPASTEQSEQTKQASTTAGVSPVPADTTPASTSSSTSEPPPPGLHDLPTFVVPSGYQVQDRWIDGPARVTLFEPTSEPADPAELLDIALNGLGDWVTTDTGVTDGVTWALLEHDLHPWCLWLEIYWQGSAPGADDAGIEVQAATFLLAESPFCSPTPGSFA